MSDRPDLRHILEAALLASDQPMTLAQMAALFEEDEQPPNSDITSALRQLGDDCEDRGVELVQVASGWRLQVRSSMLPWVSRMWRERPQKYSRALLETLSLIAYRQPITRGEIESVRGVSLSSSIIRTLQERDWIRVVGHRDVPGKPALFGTTKSFLDYFALRSLDQLPTLAEIKDMDTLEPELDFEGPDANGAEELDASDESAAEHDALPSPELDESSAELVEEQE